MEPTLDREEPIFSGPEDGIGAAARFGWPGGVVLDGVGNLFVADFNFHTIRKIELATGAVTTLAGTSWNGGGANGTGTAARFINPTGVAVDGAGNAYIADTDTSSIRKIVLATGAVTTLAGIEYLPGSYDGSGTEARFNKPQAVAVD